MRPIKLSRLSRLARLALATSALLCAAPTLALAETVEWSTIDEGAGSGFGPEGPGPVYLTAAQRRARAERIRDAAAKVGMTNAALLGGIGEVETNFAHCWSEATWACKGPASSSCGGGPVIAGAADGPCSAQQGGLGMFQFDAGTFSQTIAAYGKDIVTIEGNVGAVVPFLVTRAIESVPGVNTKQEALDWMNSIPIKSGDAKFNAWGYFVSWRYNGCKGCSTQEAKYKNGALKLYGEFGADFWKIAPVDPPMCASIPADGRTIEETDDCFSKGGPSTSWYPSETGHGDACWYTNATDEAAPQNNATWLLKFEEAGRYDVRVYTDGGEIGQTKQALYKVTHDGGTAEVRIDQSAVVGFVSLGVFDFGVGGEYTVKLGDNTGEPYVASAKIPIIFDAVQVVPEGTPADGGEDVDGDGIPDGDGENGATDGEGGCRIASVGGGASGLGGGASVTGLLFAAGLFASRRPRRRA